MSETTTERPGFIDRQLARVWGAAQRNLERELKDKMYLSLYYNSYNAKLTETLEDVYLWVEDDSIPIEWRVQELAVLVGRLSSIAGSRDDPIAFEMRSNYRGFLHDFWYGYWLQVLKSRRIRGRLGNEMALPLYQVRDIVTRNGDRWFITMGEDCVDITFGKDFHSPQFVLGMQSQPQFPFMGDFRFGGGGGEGGSGETFAEDFSKQG